ncbi:hypothetical protein FB451DRAFT_1387588 [Mycena latifolia]|nr:hypothetical protein FB451DRAFT_1387588 [Mycena latifolia]
MLPVEATGSCFRNSNTGGDDVDATYPSELPRAALGFLFAPRTDEEFLTIVRRMMSCGCLIAELGDTGVVDAPQALDMILSYLCGFMTVALENLPPAKFRKRRPNRSDARQPWPHSVGDIGLEGRTPNDAVTALLRWAEYPPLGHTIFSLLGTLSRFWRPYAQEVLQNPHVVEAMRRHLVVAAEFYVDPAPIPPSWDYFERAILSCQSLAGNLAVVEVEKSKRFEKFEEELYDLGALLIPMLVERGPRMTVGLKWFSEMLSARRISFPGAIKAEVEDPLLYNDDYFHARYQMLLTQQTRRCMHASCPSDRDAETRSVVTTLCRRCAIVRYCGRECQVAAWRADRLPHQDLCNKIHRVRQSVGLLDDQQWTNWLLRSGVPDAALLFNGNGVKQTTCRAIWLYLLWLRTEKKLVRPVGLNVRGMRGQKIQNINRRFDIGELEAVAPRK